MVYDAVDHEVVLFDGGTWTYANATWTEVCSGGSATPACAQEPPAAGFLPMTYDAADGYVLLGDYGQTWAFAHGQWTEEASNSSFDAEYSGRGTMAYDPATGSVILVGDNGNSNFGCWSYTRGLWSAVPMNVTISAREGPVLFYDPLKREMVYFGGGLYGYASGPRAEWPVSNSEWVFANGSWTTATPGTVPPGGIEAGFAWDSAAGYGVLLTGGYEGVGNQTWTYADGNWTNRTSQFGAPGDETFPSMAFDAESGYTLLLGGGLPSDPSTGSNVSWVLWHDDLRATLGASTATLQLGQQVSFQTTAWGGAGPYSLELQGLPFGCISVARFGNFTCRPLEAGTYSISGNLSAILGGTTPTGPVELTVLSDASGSVDIAPNPTTVGVATEFMVHFTAGIPAEALGWDFGDGGKSRLLGPAHVFEKPGIFEVEFSARNLSGALLTVRAPVTVNPEPTAVGAANLSTTDVGVPTSFEAQAYGGTNPLTTLWTFGDGSSSGSTAPQHAYRQPGPYTATVRVRDGVGEWSAPSELNLSVNPDPYVLFSTLPQNPAIGSQVAFGAQAMGGTPPGTYLWDFGDGVYAQGPEPAYAFTQSGNHVVKVTFSDSVGVVTSSQVNISVAAAPSLESHGSSGSTSLAPPSNPQTVGTVFAVLGIAAATAAAMAVLIAIAWVPAHPRKAAARNAPNRSTPRKSPEPCVRSR